jgi:hypothetical protein
MTPTRIPALALCLPLCLAGPAAAQDTSGMAAPGTETPEALATLVAEACLFTEVEPRIDAAALEAAGLVPVPGEGPGAFASEAGVSLSLAAREGFAACELRIPPEALAASGTDAAEDGLFSPLAGALSAVMGMTYETVDLETVEGGQIWRLVPSEGLVTTLRIQAQDPDLVITSAIAPGRIDPERALDGAGE